MGATFSIPTVELLQRLGSSDDGIQLDNWDSWIENKVDSSLVYVLDSFETYGFSRKGPLLVDMEGDGWILKNGHHRLLAAILLVLPNVWVEPYCGKWVEPKACKMPNYGTPEWSARYDAAQVYLEEIRHAFV